MYNPLWMLVAFTTLVAIIALARATKYKSLWHSELSEVYDLRAKQKPEASNFWYTHERPLSSKQLGPFMEWIEQHEGDSLTYNVTYGAGRDGYNRHSNDGHATVWITDAKLAMLYKLTWAGVQ